MTLLYNQLCVSLLECQLMQQPKCNLCQVLQVILNKHKIHIKHSNDTHATNHPQLALVVRHTVHTYVRTYVCTYIHTYIHTYIQNDNPQTSYRVACHWCMFCNEGTVDILLYHQVTKDAYLSAAISYSFHLHNRTINKKGF